MEVKLSLNKRNHCETVCQVYEDNVLLHMALTWKNCKLLAFSSLRGYIARLRHGFYIVLINTDIS